MLTVVKAFLFLLLILLAAWSLIGIFDDSVIAFKFLNFFGQLVPYFSLALAASLFYLLKASRLKWLAITICLPSFIVPFLAPSVNLYTGLDTPLSPNAAEQNFTFITFSKMSHNLNYAEVAKVIDCTKYDVIQVQEIWDLPALLAAFPKVAEHCNYAVHPEKPSLATFSKFPLVAKTVEGKAFVEVNINEVPVAVVNVHALKAITRGADSQIAQAKRMVKLEQTLNMPTIVAGDFNATPFNESIMLMRKHFKQAQLDSGMFTRRSTWPGEARRLGTFGPLLQIDYIFYKGLNSANTFIHESSYGSDHYPMQTTFSLSAKG